MPRGSDQNSLTGELSDRVRTGVLWLGLVNAATRGSQIVVTLALAAIFTESDLGLVALAMSLVNTAMLVQSMGVNWVISLTERDKLFWAGTVLTMSFLPGPFLPLVGFIGSSQIPRALGAPAAAPLIATVAMGLPFMGIAWLQ